MAHDATETIGDILRHYAGEVPDAPALVAERQEPLSYRGLVEAMDRVRHRLYAAGFGCGDRIAAIGRSDTANAALIVALWDSAIAVPMNPSLSTEEFIAYLRRLGARAVAVDAGLDTAVRAAASRLDLPILEVECIDDRFAGLIDVRPGPAAGAPRRTDRPATGDVAMVLLTSGTNSRSKAVAITHRELVNRARSISRSLELTAADRCLNLMPLYHGHGLSGTLAATLYPGGSVISLGSFSVDRFYRLLGALAPTWYTASYTFQHAVCAAAAKHSAAIGKAPLRFIRTASGRLEPRVAKDLESFFRAPVIEIYSSTETSTVCSTPLPPAARKPGTAGIPIAGEVAIMSADGRFLPTGERGEILVRCDDMFSGYENDPAANAEAFFDGWYRTGDEGMFDDDGYLTITGRIKDVINRGGEKVASSEVDEALLSHPDVAAAVAFPIPHATLGQDVAAAVVPAKGAVLSDEMLARYLHARIAPFKVPRRILLVDEIPAGPTGKIQRSELARAFGLVDARTLPGGRKVDDRPATPLEAKLQRIWADVLRLDHVGLDEDFFMLGGDSLQAVELFLRIEKELGRRLPRATLLSDGTVAKMAEQIEAGMTTACLVPIQPRGDRPPFFCVHDGNGQILNYRDLARLVGEAQPFYGIQCRGLDGEEEPFTNIDDMAAYYVQEIRKVQPVGPYYIGGYSFGGRVAYVMAQQLRAVGEEVAFLGLFDVYSQAGRAKVELGDWLAHHWNRLKALPARALPGYLGLRVSNLIKTIYMKLRLKSYSAAWHFFKKRGKPLPRFLYRPVAANDMVRRGYRARPYDGDATLFKAELYAWAHADQHDGWHRLIKGNLDVRPISGRHYEIVKPPHVQTLARELSDALQKAQAAQAVRSTPTGLSRKVS